MWSWWREMEYQRYQLRDIGDIVSGATPKTTVAENFGGAIPWLTPADLSGYTQKYISRGKRNLTQLGYDSCSTQIMPSGTVLFSSRAPIGYTAIAKNPICTNQGFKSIVPKPFVNSEFLYYQLIYLRKTIQDMGSGTTFKEISAKKFGAVQVTIPPLVEQEHIISRIEELFSQLDVSVNELKTAKERLKVYRQAVLKEAFEGRYSRAWRKNHPEYSPQNDLDSIKFTEPIFKDTSGDENEICLSLPETWVKVRLGEIFEVEVGATPSRQKTEYWNGEIPWVSSGEVHFDTISRTNEFITQEGLKHASTNIQPVGTVMLAMIGEGKTRGQAALLHVEAAHNQNTAAILVSKTSCEPKYVYYFLMLNYENTRRVGSGNNQKALNKERVRALRFPFTSFEEQSLIVQEIESRLSVCDSIQKTVDTALQQAETLRQSILKKAFEGGL